MKVTITDKRGHQIWTTTNDPPRGGGSDSIYLYDPRIGGSLSSCRGSLGATDPHIFSAVVQLVLLPLAWQFVVLDGWMRMICRLLVNTTASL